LLDLAAKCTGALAAGGGVDDYEDGGHGGEGKNSKLASIFNGRRWMACVASLRSKSEIRKGGNGGSRG
jgi:hypothetical protein